MMKKGREVKYLIWEAILLVCLFAAGIGIRIYNMPTESYGLGSFYDAAVISNQSAVPYNPGTGINQIYLYLLRCLFTIFGNVWKVGTIAQLVLFIVGAIVFYFAIRKVSGSIGSLLIIGVMLCIPCFLPITYAYGSQMLYFLLFGVGLYYTHSFVVDCAELEECGVIFILQTIFTGLYAGLLMYLDLFSLVLIMPVLLLPYLMRNNLGILKGLGIFLVWLVSAAVCVVGGGFAEGLLSGLPMGTVLEHWLRYSYGQLFELPVISAAFSWEVLLCDRHIWLGLFLVASYISVLIYFVVYLLFFRTTRSVRELDVEGLLIHETEEDDENVVEQMVEAEEAIEAVQEQTMTVDNVVETATESVEEVTQSVRDASEEMVVLETESTVSVEQNKPAVSLLQNPLPLPRAHVKKVLDYAFQPDFEDMDYDIRVSDKDDYDIK